MPDILDMLEAAASGRGKVSVVPFDSDWTSFAAVWDRSERIAWALCARTSQGGSVAAVLTPSIDAFATIAAVWRAGRTLVSLPQPARGEDPVVYADRVTQMAGSAGAELFVTDDRYASLVETVAVPSTTFAALASSPAPRVGLDVAGAGLVQFTSGSTGTPKGVPLTMAQIGQNVAEIAEVLEVRAGDAGCSWLPLSHDMGLIGSCLVNWAAAGITGDHSLAYIDTAKFVARPSIWLERCSQVHATTTAAPSFALDLAVRFLPRMRNVDLSAMRAVITGSERVRASTLHSFAEVASPHGLRETALAPAYGLAEATLAVALTRQGERWRSVSVDPLAAAAGEWHPTDGPGGLELVANGCPLPSMSVDVDAPTGGVGEICLDGPAVFDGYFATPQRSGPHRTGDLGAIVDGHVYVVGRVDDQLSVRGRNLCGADIEAAVEALAGLRGGAVAAVADDGGYAVVVERPKRSDADWGPRVAEATRAVLAARVGVAPTRVVVVAAGVLPRTPSGKTRRPLVAAELAAGAFDAELTRSFGPTSRTSTP